MQKRYNIKWRKSDERELSNAVRKFNAKRTRLLKQVPELVDFLPDKLLVKEVRSSIQTRAGYKKAINSINRFLRKGAEKPIVTSTGVKTTAYQKRELQIKVQTINRQRAAERKRANVSTEKGTMGTIRANSLLPKKVNIDKVKKSDWQAFIRTVELQSRETYFSEKGLRYKKNYIATAYQAFGAKGQEIVDIVNKLPPDVLTQAYYDDPVLQIDFYYDPLEEETMLELITEHWEYYLENNPV